MLSEKAGVSQDVRDILAIQRIPVINTNLPRPLIVKFVTNDEICHPKENKAERYFYHD